MAPLSRAREFFSAYTQDLTSDELGKVFTRDAPEAYRFFTRGVDSKTFRALPRHTRMLRWTQAFFTAFTMRLTPARRAIYGVALLSAAFGVVSLFRGISVFGVPVVLMAQDGRGTPTFYGRKDIANFMSGVPLNVIPWREYTIN